MSNLFLPEIDYSKPSEFNMKHYSYWSLGNKHTLEDYAYIDMAFSETECQEIIKLGNHYAIEQSKTAGGSGFSEIRKSENSWLNASQLSMWIYSRIQEKIEQINDRFFGFELNSIEPLQFTKYSCGYNGNYKKHLDKFSSTDIPNLHRKLSFSVQLTNPEFYEGGELAIYSGETPIIADKNIGCINFFPSYMMHEVRPVTKGIRYSLVGWCSGPRFR